MTYRLSLRTVTGMILMVMLLAGWLASPGADAQTRRITLAGQEAIDHPTTQRMYKFKEKIESATDGRIQVSVFPASQLGDYVQVFQEVMRGTIDMAVISVPSQFDSRLELTYLHYVAEDYEQALRMYAKGSFIYNKMDELLGNLGIKFLGFDVAGFGGLGMVKWPNEPLNPEVDKGVLLRVFPMEVSRQAAEDIGYRTVTIPYAELYVALQTGVADGWTGGTAAMNYHSFRDAINYYLQINNFMENNSILMNRRLWDSLSPEDQALFEEAAGEFMEDSITSAEENEKKYLQLLEEAGVEVFTYTAEELRPLAEWTRRVTWPKLASRLSQEIIEEFQKQF